MYSFIKGNRLFLRGSRDKEDSDNVADTSDKQLVLDDRSEHESTNMQTKTHMASASQESREMFTSSRNRNGLKTVHTQRVVRKTTTVTRGEQKQTVCLLMDSELPKRESIECLNAFRRPLFQQMNH